MVVSAADLKWPDMIQAIAKQYNTYNTDDKVAELTLDIHLFWDPQILFVRQHYTLNHNYICLL